MGGVEGGQALQTGIAVEIADIGKPALVAGGIGRHTQQDDEDVQCRRREHGGNKNPVELVFLELEFLRRVGDALKADEGPGRDEGDAQGLHHCSPLGNKGRGETHFAAQKRRGGAEGDPDAEDQHHHDHGVGGDPLAVNAQGDHADDGKHGQQRLSQVNLIAEHGKEVAELEGAADKIAGKQGQAGGVCPEHGDVGQTEKPEDQKSAVIAKDLPRVGINAPGKGIAACHVEEVAADNEHQRHADKQAEDAAGGSRLGEVGVGRDDQRSPAHAGAHRQRPGCSGRKIGLKACLRFLVFHFGSLRKTFCTAAVFKRAGALCGRACRKGARARRACPDGRSCPLSGCSPHHRRRHWRS